MHVTQRGHNRDATFLDERDFGTYREILVEASARAHCTVHSYALMSNHVHILVTPSSSLAAARLLQSVGSRFVRYWNKRHSRSGTLWDGRFRSSIVDSDAYLLACCRYIDLNPVRAGMVVSAEQYAWSSHRHLAYGERDAVVKPHGAYLALGSTERERMHAYRQYCQLSGPKTVLDAIRDATRGGSAVGRREFHSALGSRLNRSTQRSTHGGDRRSERWNEIARAGGAIP
jgi:putative transposase